RKPSALLRTPTMTAHLRQQKKRSQTAPFVGAHHSRTACRCQSSALQRAVVPEGTIGLPLGIRPAQADVLEHEVAQRGELPALLIQVSPALQIGRPTSELQSRE